MPLQKLPNSQHQHPSPPPLLLRELIMEILSWLPVETLIHLKRVCKSWNSIISDPDFAKLHLHRSPKIPSLMVTLLPQFPFLIEETKISVLFSTVQSFIQNPSSTFSAQEGRYTFKSKYWALGSCNGLVCLCKCFDDVDNDFAEYWFRVWNPLVRFRSEKSPSLRVNFGVNESDFTRFGFGCDESSDTFKVVAIVCDRDAMEDSQGTKVKIYSFGDTCWRDIQSFPAFPLALRNEGKFIDGTLNWLAVRNMSGSYTWKTVTMDKLVIVSLDLGKETYKQFLLPNGIEEVPHVEPTLEVLRGCLYLFHDYKDTHFVVWKMNEFGVEKSWTQFVKVSYPHLRVEQFPEIFTQFLALAPLCVSEDGDVLMLGNNDRSEIILYDRRDNRVEATKFFNFRGWINAKDHFQSLVLPY